MAAYVALSAAALLGLVFIAAVGFDVVSRLKKTTAEEAAHHFQPIELESASQEMTSEAISTTAAALSPETVAIDKIAEAFVEHAENQKAKEAFALIDRPQFQKLQTGKQGSYFASYRGLKAEEVLKHLGYYSIDSSPEDGGPTHWDLIGRTKVDGNEARIIRHYAEPQRMKDILDNNTISMLAKLMSFDELKEVAPNVDLVRLYDVPRIESGLYGPLVDFRIRPNNIDYNRIISPRVSYTLLLFDRTIAGTEQPCDIKDMMSGWRMSQTAGDRFESDHRFHGSYPIDHSNQWAEKDEFSVFGPLPMNTGRAIVNISTERSFLAREPLKKSKLSDDSPTLRTDFLQVVAVKSQEQPSEVRSLIEQFGREHPSDPGADLAALFVLLLHEKPLVNDEHGMLLDYVTHRLYERWQDPFLLFIQGMVAEKRGDFSAAATLHGRALEAEFESLAGYGYFIRQAAARGDKEAALGWLRKASVLWGKNPLKKDNTAHLGYNARTVESEWKIALIKMEQAAHRAEREQQADNDKENSPFGRFRARSRRSGRDDAAASETPNPETEAMPSSQTPDSSRRPFGSEEEARMEHERRAAEFHKQAEERHKQDVERRRQDMDRRRSSN